MTQLDPGQCPGEGRVCAGGGGGGRTPCRREWPPAVTVFVTTRALPHSPSMLWVDAFYCKDIGDERHMRRATRYVNSAGDSDIASGRVIQNRSE